MSAVMEHPALEALRARAIASSSEESVWLSARARGITATGIAALMKGGPGARRGLLEEKLRGGNSFHGNQYTEWGKLREAAIARDVADRTAIAPNDILFHSVANERHLATPDGVGVNFAGLIELSEIKTSKHDLNPGATSDDGVLLMVEGDGRWKPEYPAPSSYFWSTGYYDQVQWQLFVCGAERARFTWEQHDDDWSEWPARGPRPVAEVLPWCWILRDEMRIAELIAAADDFLLDFDLLLRDAADGVAPEIDDEMDTLAVNLLRFRAMEAEGKKAKEGVWKQMLDRAEGCDPFSQESALARVTWSPGEETTSDVADVEAAKAADPDLFAEVQALSKRWNEHQASYRKTVVTPGKNTLTVTAVKQKETKK